MQIIDSGTPLHDRGNEAPPPVGSDSTEPWFAVYTTSRHEKRVAQHMEQREIEHFLPLYRTNRKWRDGSRVTLELPLFPCYIFVRIQRSERARVLGVPGALALINGTGGDPAVIQGAAIEALRSGVANGTVEPHPILTVGQHVRIHQGPFAGMLGVVARKKNGFRVVLTLQQIMQSLAIEVNESDVEVLDAALPAKRFESGAVGLRWQHA